jgi:hypothetical protein
MPIERDRASSSALGDARLPRIASRSRRAGPAALRETCSPRSRRERRPRAKPATSATSHPLRVVRNCPQWWAIKVSNLCAGGHPARGSVASISSSGPAKTPRRLRVVHDVGAPSESVRSRLGGDSTAFEPPFCASFTALCDRPPLGQAPARREPPRKSGRASSSAAAVQRPVSRQLPRVL